MIIIVINVRKTKESEVSVLFKIMANYLQLITTSMSFSSSFPTVLTDMLLPAQRLGGSSETFLSFDCFITDYEVKGPFPSNVLLKFFLAAFLPLILFAIVAFIWLFIHFVVKRWSQNLSRALIISFISILFLLHPKLTELSLSIFRCVDIDEDESRARIDTTITCYSAKHLKWCFALGLPIIVFWVISPPLIAFLLLYKNIKKEGNNKVKTYLLILYQGLKERTFYWEFVNTIRKVILLIVLLLNDTMKILFSSTMLVVTARIQMSLDPYRDSDNNKIELLAVTAGLITLMSSLIFLQEDSVDVLNVILLIFVIAINLKFILEWTYKMIQTKSDKSRLLKALTVIFEIMLMKRSAILDTTKNDKTIDEGTEIQNAKDAISEIPDSSMVGSSNRFFAKPQVTKVLYKNTRTHKKRAILNKKKRDKTILKLPKKSRENDIFETNREEYLKSSHQNPESESQNIRESEEDYDEIDGEYQDIVESFKSKPKQSKMSFQTRRFTIKHHSVTDEDNSKIMKGNDIDDSPDIRPKERIKKDKQRTRRHMKRLDQDHRLSPILDLSVNNSNSILKKKDKK